MRGMSSVVVLALVAGIAGCGGEASQKTSTAANLRMLSIASIFYANENQDALPTKLEQLKPFDGQEIGGGRFVYSEVVKNPWTGDNPGYELVGGRNDTAPNHVIVYQLRGGQRVEDGAKGYADGHVE